MLQHPAVVRDLAQQLIARGFDGARQIAVQRPEDRLPIAVAVSPIYGVQCQLKAQRRASRS
jgi:hypothetical protein